MGALSAISGGLGLASGALGLFGAYKSADGTILGGNIASQGALAAGQAEHDADYYKAAGLRINAQGERAGAQSDAFNVQRKTADLQSTLRARAAADGGGVADPTVVALSDQLQTAGSLSALTEMWKGEDKARNLVDSARGAEMSGDAALTGASYKSAGILTEARSRADAAITSGYANLLDKGSTMFDRFGNPGRRYA